MSIRGRVLINVEALNMTESVGNYVKHRRVPVMIREKEDYTVYLVPAISGESIAHGYQEVLGQIGVAYNINVCNLCKQGIFLKSTNSQVYKGAFGRAPPSDAFELEKSIIEGCLVEDVGGFLYAEKLNVKRTSNFYSGYMIPVKEALGNTVIEPQLHSRYALGTPFVKREEREARGQMIYYVELSSSTYTFSFDLDTKYIGKTTFQYGKVGKLVVNDREARLNATLEALKKFLIELLFGAKKTRFLPVIEWESLVIGVSNDVWTVPSPSSVNYIEKAKKKLKHVNYETKLYIYKSDGSKKLEDSIEFTDSFEEAVVNAINDAKKRLKVIEG